MCARRTVSHKGFTLVEMLAAIAIVALLVAAVIPWVMSYTATARQRSDQQTLVILNDALTRYKTEGGSLAALTSGAPITNVLTKLKSAITWNGLSHQVMETAFTRPPRSIDSKGDGAQYRFTRFNSSISETGGSSPIVPANFVAVGTGTNTAVYSMDGITWSTSTLPSSANWFAVTYGNGKYLAVASGGTTAAYSTDGVNWTATTLPSSGNWECVIAAGGYFLTLNRGGSSTAYSTDGISWSTGSLPSSSAWASVAYGAGNYVTVKGVGGIGSNGFTSPGIQAWNSVTTGSGPWPSVTYGGGLFVAVSTTTKETYSADGTTWTSTNVLPASGPWNSITYGNSRFVTVAGSSNRAMWSSDALTWNQVSLPSTVNWISVTYSAGQGKFVALADSGAVAYSTDGATWTGATLPASATWKSVAAK